MIRLVVFDWDGTLMDSEARIVTAMQRAFIEHGALAPGRVAVRDIIGLDLNEAVTRLAPQLEARRAAAVVQSYRLIYAGLHAIPSPLFTGAENTLKALASAGYMLAVATGKSRRGLDRALHETGVADYFALTRCGDEAAPKPDPAMLREILLELDTEPQQALMVGDTEFDLAMAAAARTHAAAATYGAHSRERLLGLDPAIVIDAPDELPGAIERFNRTTTRI